MVRIGCVQMSPTLGDLEGNLMNFSRFVEQADADLLVFPELALTGYLFSSREYAARLSSAVPGPLTDRIGLLARSKNLALVTGFLEIDEGKLYNSAIVFDRHGELVGHYRKVHLFYAEKLFFTPGDLGFPVFDVEVRTGNKIRLGIQICYDWRFPESTRSLAIKGAEVVAIPSNIVTQTGMLLQTLRVRAFENNVIVAFADRVGTESGRIEEEMTNLTFQGGSCIINYNGDVLASSSSVDESITCADVLTENTRSKNINKFNDIINDMRINTYFT